MEHYLKNEKLKNCSLIECPTIKNSRLKKQSKRKALNISGDFAILVISNSSVGFVPVVKRQKGLNYSGYPEKAQKTGNKHEHLP